MKPKRKIQINGLWWLPTRQFSFPLDRPIDDVYEMLEDFALDKNGWVKLRQPDKSKKSSDFKLRKRLTKTPNTYLLMDVNLLRQGVGTQVEGKISLGDRLTYGLFFFLYFLLVGIVGLVGLVASLLTGQPFSLFFLIFPIIWLIFYLQSLYRREQAIDDFYRTLTIDTPKGKRSQ